MIKAIGFVIVGILIIFILMRLQNQDDDSYLISKAITGYIAGVILIIIGLIMLFNS